MNLYIDGSGTRMHVGDISESDARATQTINFSRQVDQLAKQNELYEKEIKTTKRVAWATFAVSLGSLLCSIAALFIS